MEVTPRHLPPRQLSPGDNYHLRHLPPITFTPVDTYPHLNTMLTLTRRHLLWDCAIGNSNIQRCLSAKDFATVSNNKVFEFPACSLTLEIYNACYS